MEGAGILTLCAVLLLLPFELWQAHAQKLRNLSPHELNLRRATQPLGAATLLLAGWWLFGDLGAGQALEKITHHPADHPWVSALLGGALLYVSASFITGMRRCWGTRSDGMLPVRAFLKMALGFGGLALLHSGWPVVVDARTHLLWLAIGAASIWCISVGAARFLLLTVGGGNARRAVQRHINQRNAPLRAARRPWWRLWW
jgi:hypothetical protein